MSVTLAAATLPDAYFSVRICIALTKWAAYALKSRVALHAASVAKYWNLAPLAGEAVTQKLVGWNDYLPMPMHSIKNVLKHLSSL